ncbi:hypothetical protein [Sinorhizobium fredii]|uniref:hypothetical protein n=1 Tax=Rhizobium fredii TaxID=380 RepID=UPI00059DD2CA|nr:hypothetical protein [Sinorhizobium fredii]
MSLKADLMGLTASAPGRSRSLTDPLSTQFSWTENAILVEPEFNAGRLRFLAIEVDAQDYDGDNEAANDQVQGIVLLHEESNLAFL